MRVSLYTQDQTAAHELWRPAGSTPKSICCDDL